MVKVVNEFEYQKTFQTDAARKLDLSSHAQTRPSDDAEHTKFNKRPLIEKITFQ